MKRINISCYNTLVFFLIRGCFIGICSNNLYHTVGQNGYISIILSLITGIIPLMFYYFIMKEYPDKNIFEIINIKFKYGIIINTLLVLFTVIYTSSIFYNLIEFINIEYLFKTPKIIISIIFSVCLLYLVNKGINTISRVSLIFFYLFCILFVTMFLGTFNLVDITKLLPFNEYGLNSILKGSYYFISYNISPLFLLTFIPYNKINKHNKFIKNFLIFYILGVLSIFIIYFFVITIYGSKMANLFVYPEFLLLKRLNIIGFLERVENILSLLFVFEMFISISISISFILEYFKVYKKNTTIIKIGIILILNILSLNGFNKFFFSNTLVNLCSFFFILIPSLIFIKKNYTDV